MTTDEQLVQDFQRGSSEAFTELFRRYHERIFAFFRRRVNDAGAAEDLAQEVFLGVLRGVTRYEPRAPFRSYLFGVAFNLLAAHRRKKPPGENRTEEIPDPAGGGNLDAALWMRQALNRLEDSAREILMLREYEQLSYEDIAGLLHVPVNTVRSRLFRARLDLRALLAPPKTVTSDK